MQTKATDIGKGFDGHHLQKARASCANEDEQGTLRNERFKTK